MISNQGPFRRLGSSTGRRLAFGANDTGGNTFTVDEVKQMLTDAGYPIPDDATTKAEVVAAFESLVNSGQGGNGGGDGEQVRVLSLSLQRLNVPFAQSRTLARQLSLMPANDRRRIMDAHKVAYDMALTHRARQFAYGPMTKERAKAVAESFNRPRRF